MHLSQQELTTLKHKLEEQELKLRSIVSSLEKTDPKEDPDRLNENADAGDDATEERELIRHESLSVESRDMLRRVEEAMTRMEDGSYGHTLEGKEIPFARLMIDPTATTLVE